MKKLTVMLLIAAMVLGVSACGNSANKENTATESQMSTQEAEDLDAKINELTQKENSILENHKALWEKVFNSIDKSTVKDATATNYGDFLANSLDKIKDKFTDDELKSLKEDVEEIKKLEDELQPLLEKQSANASNKDSGKEGASVFPEFKAKDLDGNDVDSSIISKNAVTVLNFWFNGCSPCVQELPELNKLNEELKEKGLFEKTIIVVLSDHGDYCGEYGLIRKGVGLSESLTRIPMVWAGYQIKKQPKAIDAHVSLADLFPTFCTAIGDSIPVGVQGRSLWPMLTGKEYPKEEFSSVVVQLGFGGEDVPLDDSLTFEQEGALGPNKVAHFDELNTWTQSGTSRMVRMGDWKLIMNSYGKGELYNLKKDPYEINNLFGNPKLIDKQSELLTKLLAWELRLQDPLPLPRHRYHFKRNPYNYHFTD